jgi:dinuclear metal center YbgI/SA1388 family protein
LDDNLKEPGMNGMKKDIPRVSDITAIIERWAPPALAEHWDNCGLQVGSYHWPVKKIWVALDPLYRVIEAAAGKNIDLVITHHPMTIKPLSTIDVNTPLGKVIEKAIITRTAIYAAHTNLDSASDGINDILARAFGMTDCLALAPALDPTTRTNGPQTGLGRIGRIHPAVPVERFVEKLKAVLNIDTVKIAGDRKIMLDKVAVCSGGGGGLLEAFFNSDAQAYISGDMRYHDARAAEDMGKLLIDVGHFPSEHVVVKTLVERLKNEMAGYDWPVQVEGCPWEKEPFVTI